MFVYPIFWGCKYTNNFLFINKKAEFQCFELLITLFLLADFVLTEDIAIEAYSDFDDTFHARIVRIHSQKRRPIVSIPVLDMTDSGPGAILKTGDGVLI